MVKVVVFIMKVNVVYKGKYSHSCLIYTTSLLMNNTIYIVTGANCYLKKKILGFAYPGIFLPHSDS